MRKIRSRDVGVLIEGHGAKPVVLLYIDHIMLTCECANADHAERVAAEVADVFDLWAEDHPKWIGGSRDRFAVETPVENTSGSADAVETTTDET